MFINVTIEVGGQRRDIRIDSGQKIKEALIVLMQSGKLPMISPSNRDFPNFFRSRLNKSLVSSHKTFAQEGVYDGDVLVALDNQI